MNAKVTYTQVGATREAVLPAGYKHVRRDVDIGAGGETFDRAVTALLHWRMHRAAGIGVTAAGPATPGQPVLLRFGVAAPVRVIYRVDLPDRQGFAYGTLPGHPECGEEAFLVHLTGSGRVRFRITAFSRPATLLARLGGPVTGLIQVYVTNRYVSALRDLSGR
ncbi:DUF1990 family protein [Actinoplanes flavus]|uniref:DUF1990 domain-containing protein n=1 Tax=Actinoplanes flavus TaxID=2820290 RepID=A0ABS3UVE4_9ACTN|nr:DUF1990 domain-containing protein [Actinoplanes flavus]MBO3742545.1 DUF1990 domain-containing protein [Actinoplanes flavus]